MVYFLEFYIHLERKKIRTYFEESDILKITNVKIIEIFSSKDNTFKSYTNQIFNQEILLVDPEESIQIINKTNISDDNLKEKFNFIFINKNVSLKETFDINRNYEKIILITKIGYIRFDEIYSIIKHLNILNKKFFGIILLD